MGRRLEKLHFIVDRMVMAVVVLLIMVIIDKAGVRGAGALPLPKKSAAYTNFGVFGDGEGDCFIFEKNKDRKK